MDCTVHGIIQARILEWVTFPFSRGSSQPRDQTQVSHIASGFFTRVKKADKLQSWGVEWHHTLLPIGAHVCKLQWKRMGLESGLLWGCHHSTAQGITWLGHLCPYRPQRRNPRDSSACNWSQAFSRCGKAEICLWGQHGSKVLLGSSWEWLLPHQHQKSAAEYRLEKRKSKSQWGITSHWSEWPSSKSLQIINAGEGVEEREPSHTVGGNIKWYSHHGEQYGVSLKN